MLESKLLSPHKKLVDIYTNYINNKNDIVVKWGEKGPHVRALQQGMNILRRNRPRRDWPRLKEDGVFGNKTFAAVKACQDYLNRVNRMSAESFARGYSPPGTRRYKKEYYDVRKKIKSDGIPGWRTIGEMDFLLKAQVY